MKAFDNLPLEKLGKVLLVDRLELTSSIYSGDHMFILKTEEEKKKPENPNIARLQQNLKPEWYHMYDQRAAGYSGAHVHSNKMQHIEPAEIRNVDFDRDLGTL